MMYFSRSTQQPVDRSGMIFTAPTVRYVSPPAPQQHLLGGTAQPVVRQASTQEPSKNTMLATRLSTIQEESASYRGSTDSTLLKKQFSIQKTKTEANPLQLGFKNPEGKGKQLQKHQLPTIAEEANQLRQSEMEAAGRIIQKSILPNTAPQPSFAQGFQMARPPTQQPQGTWGCFSDIFRLCPR